MKFKCQTWKKNVYLLEREAKFKKGPNKEFSHWYEASWSLTLRQLVRWLLHHEELTILLVCIPEVGSKNGGRFPKKNGGTNLLGFVPEVVTDLIRPRWLTCCSGNEADCLGRVHYGRSPMGGPATCSHVCLLITVWIPLRCQIKPWCPRLELGTHVWSQ